MLSVQRKDFNANPDLTVETDITDENAEKCRKTKTATTNSSSNRVNTSSYKHFCLASTTLA